jgi:hypothetical protein
MNLLGRYGYDDEDTERPAKKAKTVFRFLIILDFRRS